MVEGTPKFISISCHKGGSPGRRDDLESLGYVLLDLMGCSLPWSNSKNDEDCLTCKSNANLEKLCVDVPCMAKFISLARKTPYDAKPDYGGFKCLLDDLSSKEVVLAEQQPSQQQLKRRKRKVSLKKGPDDNAPSFSLPLPSNHRKSSKSSLGLKSGRVSKSSNPKRLRRSSRGSSETAANKYSDESVKRSSRSTSSSTHSKVKGVTVAATSSSPSVPLPFILVCTGGPCEGTTYDVSVRRGGGLIVGSGVKAGIQIVGDSSISDAHVKLSYVEEKPKMLLVHRLSNGNLFVNTTSLPKASSRVHRYLKDKDVLTVGNTQLVLRRSKS